MDGTISRDSALTRHIGHPIVVYSCDQTGVHRDAGTLLAADSTWVAVKKSDGEMLYFSVYNIRAIKVGE